MSRYYVNKATPEVGSYEILRVEGAGFIWRWREVAKGIEYVDDSRLFPTMAECLRAAAWDWEANGMSANRRFGGVLRAAATRCERESGE